MVCRTACLIFPSMRPRARFVAAEPFGNAFGATKVVYLVRHAESQENVALRSVAHTGAMQGSPLGHAYSRSVISGFLFQCIGFSSAPVWFSVSPADSAGPLQLLRCRPRGAARTARCPRSRGSGAAAWTRT